MYRVYIMVLIALLSLKCQTPPDKKVITVTHYNILFAPDMSNRVDPRRYQRPLNDADILSVVGYDLYPTILMFGKSEFQQDKLMIDFINKGLINQYGVNTDKFLIDFGRFSNPNDRISYIKGKDSSKKSLENDLNEMRAEFTRVNNRAIKQNTGADIWSYFNQGIDEQRIMLPEKPVKYLNYTYVNTYRNILILLTDGYIEAGIYKKGFDLSDNSIKEFRCAFLKSGASDMQQFLDSNRQFQIKPVNNSNLNNLEVLVMELYDRSLSPGGAATVHPTDMEIIKLLWANWLQQSKVKRFELHPYVSSKGEAEKIILHFMGITKG